MKVALEVWDDPNRVKVNEDLTTPEVRDRVERWFKASAKRPWDCLPGGHMIGGF